MKTSDKGIAALELREGHSEDASDPYGLYDNDGSKTKNATEGYGHLLHKGALTEADKAAYKKAYPNGMSKDQAVALLKSDIASSETSVQTNITVQITQNQFDALVMFQFNTNGIESGSTLENDINGGGASAATIKADFEMWNKSGTPLEVTPGLTNRRDAEAAIFNDNNYNWTP